MVRNFLLVALLMMVVSLPTAAKQLEAKPAPGKAGKKPAAPVPASPVPVSPVMEARSERTMLWSVFLDGKTISVTPVEQGGKLYLPVQDLAQFLNMDVKVDPATRIVDLKTRGLGTALSPYLIRDIKKIAVFPFLESTIEKVKGDSTVYPGSGEDFTKDIAKLLFETSAFTIVPHAITTYNWNLNEVKEFGKRLGVEGVLIGRVKRYEFRTEPGFLNDYVVEVAAEAALVETNTGMIVWRQEEGGRNGAFNPFTAGAEGRRKRFLRDIVQQASQKMVEELVTFRKMNG